MIIAIGLRDEAIVGRIMYRGKQDSVEPEKPGILVQFIFAF
jgi:hypothetical protein